LNETIEYMSELEPESSAEVEPPGNSRRGGFTLISGTDGMVRFNGGLCGSGDVGDEGVNPLDHTPGSNRLLSTEAWPGSGVDDLGPAAG
jgi:hypothetical protein